MKKTKDTLGPCSNLRVYNRLDAKLLGTDLQGTDPTEAKLQGADPQDAKLDSDAR